LTALSCRVQVTVQTLRKVGPGFVDKALLFS